MSWHDKQGDLVLQELRSSREGLSSREAERRLEEYGPNVLEEQRRSPIFLVFVSQFADFMILVLTAAAVLAAAIGETVNAAAIFAIVILNAVIGFIQEYRAESAVRELRHLAEPEALVLRDRAVVSVPASALVPGDVVLLDAGRAVPADMRLLQVTRLTVDESALTGESDAVEKQAQPLTDPDLPLGDRTNMAYSGTFVTHGRATGVVVATGMRTELGRIASMLQTEARVRTPLQRRLAGFGRALTLAIMAACSAYFAAGIVLGEGWVAMFLTAIALAVAAIPEALPAVVSITLALGARGMARRNALLRRLPAVETLGSVTFICADKTGTLTANRLAVEEVFVEGAFFRGADLGGRGGELLRAVSLCNDATVDPKGAFVGSPIEVALLSFAEINGFDKRELEEEMPRLAEIPFDPVRKCMTTFHRLSGEGVVSFTKGAAEVLLRMSESALTPEGTMELDADKAYEALERMTGDGLRVLGVAMRRWKGLPEAVSPEAVEGGMVLLGLVGMGDATREGAREAVSRCRAAGITPVMITGDHPLTAVAVARRLGILAEGEDEVITGAELAALTLEELESRVEKVRVYARVSPEDKLKIVRALRDRGHIVAMTGDGINDAPALRAADIGVAMGLSGTDVAREASEMVLLDDDFSTVVGAVAEGRRIYDNILKYLKYTMASNAATLITVFLAPFLGIPLPLQPVQILWMNLLCDSLPGLALTAERAGDDVMDRPPVPPAERVLDGGRGLFVLRYGALMGLAALVFLAWAHGRVPHWQTMLFTSLLLGRLAVALTVRSEKASLFRMGIFSNIPLTGSVLLIAALQMLILYLPPAGRVFLTQPLAAAELALSCLLFILVLAFSEGEKALRRRRARR